MAKEKYLSLLKKSADQWNDWRANQPVDEPGEPPDLHGATSEQIKAWMKYRVRARAERIDLDDADLDGMHLSMINLSRVSLEGASLRKAYLADADFTEASLAKVDFREANLEAAIFERADLTQANLVGAKFYRGAKLKEAKLPTAKLAGAKLVQANFSGADLTLADLSDADLSEADFRGANLWAANLRGAKLSGARFDEANVTHVRWGGRMRGRYLGVRGLDSCYGNALFKRAAADQDYLDTLEESIRFSFWGTVLFWAWACLDYGRSLGRVACLATGIAVGYGYIYARWPELLNFSESAKSDFTPYYFSIVTFTTLGFGDIKPATRTAEIIVSSEVILGYTLLGLLLAVLAEKLARRS
jgi:uncharacterized protein YjbI with pentapeptide repeats